MSQESHHGIVNPLLSPLVELVVLSTFEGGGGGHKKEGGLI